MFGKRKHRADEEEQSLVPHGLVWQAMAETASAEESKDKVEPATPPATTLQIVAPPVQHGLVWQAMAETAPAEESRDVVEPATPPATTLQIVAPPVQLSEDESPAAPPAEKRHGSSLFWRKVVGPETVRPATPGVIPLQRPGRDVATENGSDQYESSAPHPPEHEAMPAKAAEWLSVQVARRLSEQRKQAARIVLNFRKFMGVVGQGGVAAVARARAKMPTGRQLAGFKSRMVRASDFVAARARLAGSTVRHGYEQLKARAQVRLASSATFTRVGRASDVGASEPPVREPVPASPPGGVGGVRIKLVGLPAQGRVALTRWLSARKIKLHSLRYDSRLWTSVAMAGLSAVLAFSLILTVRRYATAALPSHVLQNNSSPPVCTPAAAASVVPPKPAPAVQSAKLSSKAVAIPPKRMDTARVVQPKSRRSQEDEYVARDTYVYYGKRRSTSR